MFPHGKRRNNCTEGQLLAMFSDNLTSLVAAFSSGMLTGLVLRRLLLLQFSESPWHVHLTIPPAQFAAPGGPGRISGP
jgi:hypothetical protein